MGSFPYPRNGVVKIDYEFILIFRKYGAAPPPAPGAKDASRLSKEEWDTYFAGHWAFSAERQDGHLAMFPEEMPRRLIKMFTFTGETVLDPFLGSGTTTLAARNLGRGSLGYEINPGFAPLIRDKLGLGVQGLFDERAPVAIEFRSAAIPDMAERRQRLPYRFHDPVRFDRKRDPTLSSFGSRVTGKEEAEIELFSVERVESGDTLVLRTGDRVRLLGIRLLAGQEEEAKAFIQQATRGKRVFLRSDPGHPPADSLTPAYVYLKNKTFLNAHLIKRGLAAPDLEVEHKHQKRFAGYYAEAQVNRESPPPKPG
jgi:site-specific DNA-methyltransferase (adenine-specific)